jgi:hypothetical protein
MPDPYKCVGARHASPAVLMRQSVHHVVDADIDGQM